MNHDLVIKDIVEDLSTLSFAVIDELIDRKHLFDDVSQLTATILGEEEYEWYVEAFSEYDTQQKREDFDAKKFWGLDEDEKKLRAYEKAEAYLFLYKLAIALKGLDRGAVIYSREVFGEGQINPAIIDQVITLREQYFQSAMALINQKSPETGGYIFIGY